MAKPTKVEDYWKQNNIENLFKELTQILVRRMPPDPAIAIVEHLQKKYPKSFKSTVDNANMISKTLPTNAQLYSMTSPHPDIHNESINETQTGRRLSNQSQVSGIVTIPTVGSAFTDLLKPDLNSSRQAPELNIKNLVFANRFTQQAVRMGKDIRSDNDIIDEEVIKPIKVQSNLSSKTDLSNDSIPENLQEVQTHEEPSVIQLIKYKQQIRNENDRRLHREKLAELAKIQREKDQIFQSDLTRTFEELEQEQKSDNENKSTEIDKTKRSHKPMVHSKEEEDILNDENMFQPCKQRQREKQRNKLTLSRTNTPYLHGQSGPNSRSRKNDGNLICKLCGNVINGEDNQLIVNAQQVSAPPPIKLPSQLPPTGQSIETTGGTVDDWFESASEASGSQNVSSWSPDDAIAPPTGSNTIRRSLFQPINNKNSETNEHQSPIRALTNTDEIKTKRTITPRVSESGIFGRSPELKNRPPSSTRSSPSPAPKKHQTSTNHPIIQPSPTKLVSTSTTTGRRMSGWGVKELSPDNSDEN